MSKLVDDYVLRNKISIWFDEQPNAAFAAHDIPQILADIEKVLRKQFETLDEVAVAVVREMGLTAKIQGIKEIRSRAQGAGLKEAKDAIERAHVTILAEKMEAATLALQAIAGDYNNAQSVVRNQTRF